MTPDMATTLAQLGASGGPVGVLIGVAVCADGQVALAGPEGSTVTSAEVVAEVDASVRPRWVLWAADDSATLIAAGVRLARAWELDAVHRILHGGWRADPVRIWCTARGLDRRTAPTAGQLDLGARRDIHGGGFASKRRSRIDARVSNRL